MNSLLSHRRNAKSDEGGLSGTRGISLSNFHISDIDGKNLSSTLSDLC